MGTTAVIGVILGIIALIGLFLFYQYIKSLETGREIEHAPIEYAIRYKTKNTEKWAYLTKVTYAKIKTVVSVYAIPDVSFIPINFEKDEYKTRINSTPAWIVLHWRELGFFTEDDFTDVIHYIFDNGNLNLDTKTRCTEA